MASSLPNLHQRKHVRAGLPPIPGNRAANAAALACPDDKPFIDLHGYTQSEGVSSLTSFLDKVTRRRKGDVWVTVVTGSGAHSQNGPVLRAAVERLLQKRQMVYTINRGKGSFTVNANTGIVFYPPESPKDTKVVVKPAINKPHGLLSSRLPSPSLLSSSLSSASPKLAASNPLPREVAANDANFAESFMEQERMVKESKREEVMLRKALSVSKLEAEKESQEYNVLLERTLSLSKLEYDKAGGEDEDDDDLKAVLEQSQNEYQEKLSSEHGEEEELRRTLELSRQSARDEDEALLEALEQSMVEF